MNCLPLSRSGPQGLSYLSTHQNRIMITKNFVRLLSSALFSSFPNVERGLAQAACLPEGWIMPGRAMNFVSGAPKAGRGVLIRLGESEDTRSAHSGWSLAEGSGGEIAHCAARPSCAHLCYC